MSSQNQIPIKIRLGEVSIGKSIRSYESRRIPLNINRTMHWAKRSRWNEAWRDEVFYAVKKLQNNHRLLPPGHWFRKLPLPGRPKVHITLYQCQEMDYDNMHSSVKIIVDALKGLVIEDDKPSKLDLSVSQIKVNHRSDERVELEIYGTTTNIPA